MQHSNEGGVDPNRSSSSSNRRLRTERVAGATCCPRRTTDGVGGGELAELLGAQDGDLALAGGESLLRASADGQHGTMRTQAQRKQMSMHKSRIDKQDG